MGIDPKSGDSQSDAILKQVAALGVRNPWNPTASELKRLLDAVHELGKLHSDDLMHYLKIVMPSVDKLLDAWKEFYAQDAVTARKHLDNVNGAIQGQRDRINKATGEAERQEATCEIQRLVSNSQDIVTNGRRFLRELTAYGFVLTVLLLIGLTALGRSQWRRGI